jgi:hypothetical protein
MAVYHYEDGRDISTCLVDHYMDYADVFSQEMIQTLLKHSEYDYKINIEPRKQPPWGHIYKLSEAELKALREYLDNVLASGKIRRLTSPASAPILFVPKPNSTL